MTGLTNCTEYFLAVKAYNSAGESDNFSPEVSGWSAPEIDRATAAADLQQGGLVDFNLTGRNLRPGSEVRLTANPMPRDEFGEPLIRVDSIGTISCTGASVTVAVEPLAAGTRAMEIGDIALTFEVEHPDTVFGDRTASYEVTFDPYRADISRVNSVTRDKLDGKDLVSLSFAYGSRQGDPLYDPDADLSGNGEIDGEDLALLAVDFGSCWNGSTWTAACP